MTLAKWPKAESLFGDHRSWSTKECMSKCANESMNNYFFFGGGGFEFFGLWLPPAKGRAGTPVVATKSGYKKKSSLFQEGSHQEESQSGGAVPESRVVFN